MGRTSLSVLLAHLVLCFAFAIPAFGETKREPSAAKRLSLRFSDPLTRRSPDMHFMRFGRSDSSGRGSDSFASKVHVKREAYKSAATIEGSSSPTSSLTCVPDADTNGRIVCYSPFNDSRHFLLVTERGSRGLNHRDQDDEPEDEAVDDQEEGSDVDGERDARATSGDRLEADADMGVGYDEEDDDKETRDEGPIDESENDAQNRTVHHSRVRDSIKQRLGRSTGSQAGGKNAFARFGRRHDTFMRLGRADAKKNELPIHELGGSSNLETDYAATLTSNKRGTQSFLRFGRERSPITYQPRSGDQRDDSPQVAAPVNDQDDDQQTTNKLLEGRHQQDAFMRPGRHGPRDMNQLRFGRSSDQIGARVARRHGSFMRLGRDGGSRGGSSDHNSHDGSDDGTFGRTARRHDNFMRLGRSGSGNFDLDMFRETRRRDSFLRLGRGGAGVGASVDNSQICGLPIDALTPRLIRRLLDDRQNPHHRPTANHSTASEDSDYALEVGDTGADAYYDSMVECLRRYVRSSTTNSPIRARLQQPSSSTVFVAGSGSSTAPYRGRNHSPYKSNDDDVYRIAMATALNSQIKA